MILPKIGDTITTEMAMVMCCHFKFYELRDYINCNRDKFRDWKFDGASMLPDKWFGETFKIPNLIEIALKHDLKYAYGISGDTPGRLKADYEFGIDLINDEVDPGLVVAMVAAVRGGGLEVLRTSFSWGFARI